MSGEIRGRAGNDLGANRARNLPPMPPRGGHRDYVGCWVAAAMHDPLVPRVAKLECAAYVAGPEELGSTSIANRGLFAVRPYPQQIESIASRLNCCQPVKTGDWRFRIRVDSIDVCRGHRPMES